MRLNGSAQNQGGFCSCRTMEVNINYKSLDLASGFLGLSEVLLAPATMANAVAAGGVT